MARPRTGPRSNFRSPMPTNASWAPAAWLLGLGDGNYVCLHPGARVRDKCWLRRCASRRWRTGSPPSLARASC
ncbi:hypothetical protein LP419_21565 [Massilia sp. H-1]|nr:hypothetical protein LP419_21565 [Massilia sp. H-1]